MVQQDLDCFERIAVGRRSVRGFLPDPVPRATIERVLRIAGSAPSNCNTQPWRVHVVSGPAADAMRGALVAAADIDPAGQPEIPVAGTYQGIWRERQIDAARRLFAARGVARDDRAGRHRSLLENFRFFSAPHAAFLFMPAWGGMREAADCGMYAQTLLLALSAAGLGSIPQAALSFHPAVVRRLLGLDPEDDHRLLMGIAFGQEDGAHPTRMVKPGRAADLVHFHDQ
jgi:nitroreductase